MIVFPKENGSVEEGSGKSSGSRNLASRNTLGRRASLKGPGNVGFAASGPDLRTQMHRDGEGRPRDYSEGLVW